MSAAAFLLKIAENKDNQEQDCRNQLKKICRKSREQCKLNTKLINYASHYYGG